jgi:hypothetical protein
LANAEGLKMKLSREQQQPHHLPLYHDCLSLFNTKMGTGGIKFEVSEQLKI